MSPKVPKVEKPKTPIEADSASSTTPNAFAVRPKGRESLVSAGALQRKAYTLKSSLLG